MDEVLSRVLWLQLQSLGMFGEEHFEMAELKARSRLSDLYNRWLEASIAFLVEHGHLTSDGESYSVKDTTPLDKEAVWGEWEAKKGAWLSDPNREAQVILLDATLRALPEILTGRVPATDIMFPNSSMELVEGIYKNNAVADFFNGVLSDTLVACIQERIREDTSARIRILEIGAGTGGTSAGVFRKLRPYREYIEEYCYTDLSKAFLMHAEKEYGPENPYLTCKIFNVEESPVGQGIESGGYDIVIATNVLHATKNIRQTVRNAKAVLKKNGVIFLNEICGNNLFSHLTFGLLEGWWLYEDRALRIPGSPALSLRTWEMVLKQEGFRSVLLPAREADELGQQIIVAESDGIVRQKPPRKPGVTSVKDAFYMQSVNGPSRETKSPVKRGGRVTEDLIREKSTAYIKKLVAETLKIPGHKIDSSEPLEKYGIDSILVVQLTNALSKVLKNISSTLFFEYQTVDALVGYFIKTQKDSLQALVGLEEGAPAEAVSVDEEIPARPVSAHPGPSLRKARRFVHIRDTEKSETDPSRVQDIAIIGLSGCYPQADNVNEFWINLKEGKNCITEIPQERWDWKKYFDEEKGKKGKIYTRWGGFVKDIDKFDPLFFQISPREAEQMDPQERLFLEAAHASIEDAGYTPANLCESRKIGVFAGVMNGNYPTGASYFSIANRISYLLNFQGPSMAVDTACSSSLTAIHLAVESLRSGMSECAIAGGVNLIVDPVHYMKLTAMNMLTSGDQCRSFGDQADGFVDGEGVGAIVLKPLQKAIADGDHIYGIIKGSMLNAGGKTNGYTVPNPNAQFQLIAEALQRAKVHARTISYIEAHGTGTSLGDPIEISGLSKAFRGYTADRQFCAIGSAKSNIGHCESAAGIAGITKVLLQLQHGQLVPSLHSAVLNPNIDFSSSPFVVQRELSEWKRPVVEVNGETREYPRIAGISSFGAGGANAHVVIEEYVERDRERSPIVFTAQNPAIIVLSAKNEERLKEHAKQLLAAIQEKQFTESDLGDMAYTLQVGREAMEERLAVMVTSIRELEDKLTGFVEGWDGIEDLYRGQVKRNKEALGVFAADDDMAKAIDAWISKGKYSKLLDLWVKGLAVDWKRLYGESRPRRISLPTYPFARERYWISESDASTVHRTSGVVVRGEVLHPLLHENTSSLSEQRFSSTFTGEEFFLADHVVKGERVLPGVAYLELARAAVEHAAELRGETGMRLKSVVWMRPITVNGSAAHVDIALYPEESGEISYEVYSRVEGNGGESLVHGQGVVEPVGAGDAPTLDIAELRTECNRSTITADRCYEAFRAMGIEYGAGHRGIEAVYSGEGRVLAKLSLPASISDTKDQYVLHPSLMDSALQAAIGLMLSEGEILSGATLKPALPFALEELEVFAGCTSSMWAYIRPGAQNKSNGSVQKLDVDVCDESGKVCVRMKGFSSRVLEGEVDSRDSSATLGTLLLEPVWKEQCVASEAVAPRYAKHVVMLCEPDEASPESVESQINGVRCLSLQSEQKGIEERFQAHAGRAFEEIQGILREKFSGEVLVQIVVPGEGEQRLFSGLTGLLKSAQLENPGIKGQLIEVEAGEDVAGIVEKLRENGRSPVDTHIRYRDGRRSVSGLIEVQASPETVSIPWKEEGVYLITGGAGGLGLIFAREMAAKARGVKLILTGRSSLNEERQARIKEFEGLGARVAYREVDVTRKESVFGLIESIREEFGGLNGIIHSAGVIRDNFIIKKSGDELQDVLSPKVRGVVNLDQASKELKFDFFIIFSSMAGCVGNIGQADYSTANAFMDAYAVYRNDLVALDQRRGRTLSVNWPLWRDGGMRVDEATERMLMQTTGMTAMGSATGIHALYRALATGKSQIMVMEGNLSRMKQKVFSITTPGAIEAKKTNATSDSLSGIDTGNLLDRVQAALKQTVSGLLKVRIEDIDADTELSEYGFDSITLTEFGNRLNHEYTLELTPTLFFEHPTLRSFAEYLVEEHQAALATKFAALPRTMASEHTVVDIPGHARSSAFNRILLRQQKRFTVPTTWPQFPELICFNQRSQGRPVFWFHGGLGGVEAYQTIAQKFQRPFYGIQARGWMTNRLPLRGIQAMSSYYTHIIQSVQPVGPYDLGGYSLGGIIAYEVTRQLQELGQTVDTIVMLDSLDSNAMKKVKKTKKTPILQAVNTAIVSANLQKKEKPSSILIHRDEVNLNTADDDFLKQLIPLAKTRGLAKTESLLHMQIQNNIKIQNAYEVEFFSILPLPDSQAVTCYYFRNKSGLFWGELEPYFSDMSDSMILVDNSRYWEEFELQLPNFHMIDVESPNHMLLLSESKSYETISAVCEKLYSKDGMASDSKPFKIL
jgi:polyketide synthase PksN